MTESVKDQLEAMIAGTHVNSEVADDTQDVGEANTTDVTDNSEDTDQGFETEDDDETESSNGNSDDETLDTEDEIEEENTHETETDDEEESEDDTVDNKVDPLEPTEEINYKEFYEKVALAKFTANGREVEGFKNPDDLVRAQQMLYGYSDKMKVLKEYKKFIKPLQDRDLMSDPDKFNLAMSLIDGDTEAIKKVIKDSGIDPMELDLEDIKYTPRNVLQSESQMILDDVASQAKDLGVEDKFYKVILDDFKDTKSFQEFIDNSAVRRDLLQHLKDGSYDIVQDEIRSMEMLDTSGELDSMSMIDKYRTAVVRLQQRHSKATPAVKQAEPKVDKVAVEKEKLEKERINAEFKRKAAEKEKEVAEQRKKAASVSQPKPAAKKKAETVNPEALSGKDFRDYFNSMMM